MKRLYVNESFESLKMLNVTLYRYNNEVNRTSINVGNSYMPILFYIFENEGIILITEVNITLDTKGR